MSPYVLLGIAVIFEVFADSMMKLSNGFTRKAPIIGIVIGYIVAFYLIAQTLEQLPLGFAYAVWTGLGIALTAVVGAPCSGMRGLNAKKIVGLIAIIAGVVVFEDGSVIMDRVHPHALLSVSIILEVFGTTMMKLSEGFSVPLFTALTLAGYLVSFTLLTFTLKHLPLGLVYGIWGGVGTVLTAAIGIIAWGDPFNVITCVGIALVVGGVVLLNQGTQELEDARKAAKDAQQA